MAASEGENQPLYADRTSGTQYESAFAMVDDYLGRYGKRSGLSVHALDSTGYTFVKRGSTGTAVNVLDDHGTLLLLAPVMGVPAGDRERFYRRLLELSFLTTGDAAFAIDAAKDQVYVRALRRLSGLDYEELEDLLDTVGRTADEWDDTLKADFAVRR